MEDITTYTDEQLEEYLIENDLWEDGVSLELQGFYNGFSFDQEIERWIPL